MPMPDAILARWQQLPDDTLEQAVPPPGASSVCTHPGVVTYERGERRCTFCQRWLLPEPPPPEESV
jgi:hypothetical protein